MMMPLSDQAKGYTALAITIVFWSSAFVGIRFCVQDYHPGSLALLRYLTASIVMFFVYLKIEKPPWRATFKDVLLIVMTGLLGIGIYNLLLNYGEITVQAATANFVIAQVPVMSIILAVMFLGEPNSKRTWIGVAVSFSGICLIALAHHPLQLHIGLFAVLAAAMVQSVYVVFQKPIFKKISAIRYTCYAIWAGSLILIVFTPQLKIDIRHASLSATLAVIYMGIFPGAIAYTLFSYGLSKITTTRAVSLLYFAPILTLLMSWLLLGEVPGALALMGGLVAILGAYVVNRRKRQSTR